MKKPGFIRLESAPKKFGLRLISNDIDNINTAVAVISADKERVFDVVPLAQNAPASRNAKSSSLFQYSIKVVPGLDVTQVADGLVTALQEKVTCPVEHQRK